ncbi:MAG: winged helix-turn-helix transcriptional regulator [Actinomycetia bacterium]|nr:winged helix-turn-helix transcriptional regulator [Actinomycetes bacterium]
MPTCDVNLVDSEKVQKVRTAIADTDTLFRMAELFKAFGDPNRVKIIWALATEELCVCDLSSVVGMTPSAASHQLRSLRNLKLVKFRRAGQMVYYSLDDKHIEMLLAQGLEHVQEDRR